MQTYEEVLVHHPDLSAMTCRGNHEHNDCSASWTSYDGDGSIAVEEWRRGGLRHREGGPACVIYLTGEVFPGHNKTHQELVDEKCLWEEDWARDGVWHRDDGPARVKYNADGSIYSESWYRDGKLHRDDGPAVVQYQRTKVFPGDTRTFEELEKDKAVDFAAWYQDDEEVERFT